MEGKDVRRRLVQKTLFPHMESPIKEAENCRGGGEEELAEEEEEEERCGSSKKRGETKRKGNSKSKMMPRASSKKDIVNGKETSSKQVDDSDSPAISKSSFFMKASERQQQQKRQQNQLVFIDSSEENDEICSTPSSVANGRSTPEKLKQQDKSTPRKEKKNSTPNKKMKSGKKDLCCGQIPFDLPVDEQPLLKIPDLRLEAKLTAEENSRIFAGRQIHPFFTSWKGGKTSQDSTDSESNWSSFGRKEKGIAFNPIHVFENVEDDHTSLNWGQWIFSEGSSTSDLQSGSSPVYEGSIDSLNFDNYLNVSHFTRKSLCQNSHQCSVPAKDFCEGLPDKPGHSHILSSLSFSDERDICTEQKDSDMLPKYTEHTLAASVESMLQDHKREENGIPCGGNMESELDKLLEERVMSHYHTCQNQPENCLWTDKYQPQNAKQICGNGESVELISEWLHLWHKRGPLGIKGRMDENTSVLQNVDHDYEPSDSDNNNGEESLKNVLLVTGPVGSGKSAAIYACARDQGFQIIEINASDWRNGALVRQKFGEAVESHWLQRSADNETKPEHRSLSKFFEVVNAVTQSSDDEVVEPTHVPDRKDSGDACSSPKKSIIHNRPANCQNEVKTLILFEDVDATLCEDHGFIATIQQLAETAKRPMILTSNSDNPVLPKNLDRLELSFSVPSVEELLELVHMICAAEKAEIHPCLIERFVDYCRGDIRKTIMLLQFWCQGQALRRGNQLQTTYWPVLFDLDAGHHVLPKVIRWDYPSLLSQLVAEEVVKSLTLMEESQGLMGRNNVDSLSYNCTENICVQNTEPDPIELKKAMMLNLQCSFGEVECTRFEANSELFDVSCSPVAFAGQNRRRKVNTVLSSDSEDELTCGSAPLLSAGVDIKAEVHETENMSNFHWLPTESCEPPAEPIFHPEVGKLDNCCQLLERVDCPHMEDTCRSHDVSFVPDSSFVPETEIIQGTELFSTTVTYGNFVNEAGSDCIFQDQDSLSIHETAVGAQSSKSFNILQNDLETLGNNFDTSSPRAYQEEVGDSLSKSETDVPREFQLLDECSRVDFIRKLKSLDNPEPDQTIYIIKETWKRLHDQCKDLKKYVTAEEKTARQVLVFAHGISNLISEADLLLKDCQSLLFDSVGSSSMVPSEETHSYSYHDNQVEMSSVLAQHGMCFYSKETSSLGSNMVAPNTLDLASEMLSSSWSSVALGKLASQDRREVNRSSTETSKSFILLMSKPDPCLCDILQTVVPSRSYLAAKDRAFHEYISTLSQISRYEASRLSECIDNRRKQRRARAPQHYLSSGSLAMSSEEISLLGRYNSYQKVPSLLGDERFR